MNPFNSYLLRKAYKKIPKLDDRLTKNEPLINETFTPIIINLTTTRRRKETDPTSTRG
jgi:hypothetical protein